MTAAGPLEDGLAAYDRGDFATAMRLWRPLAEQGNVTAQYNLGVMYAKGRGVPQDDAEAVKWYRLAAEQGNVTAQYNLGVMYAKGRGVPQDYVQAYVWFDLAASRYSASEAEDRDEAVHNRDVAASKMTPAQLAEAVKWYRLAAQQGYALAQYNLGVMYAKGRGVPQDYVQAYVWFDLAASRYSASEAEDRDEAVHNRDVAASKMTPAQLAEAQKLAREWKPK
jgi:hypothetical protein